MPLEINTNSSASIAGRLLSRNHAGLQKSLNRISSGSRITESSDDVGGLAVSIKRKGMINRMDAVDKNISNAVSFLQAQDGILESASKIVQRMSNLKILSLDVSKNSLDIANYNTEFKKLQVQLHQMGDTKFNGVSLFGVVQSDGESKVIFNTSGSEHTISIFTSELGGSGSIVEINKSSMLAALTIDSTNLSAKNAYQDISSTIKSFASETLNLAINLSDISLGMHTQALQNLATLRAENVSSSSRLQFAQRSAAYQKTNLETAVGRILDVDLASETTSLTKYKILVQASASMLAQANTTPDAALLLLR